MPQARQTKQEKEQEKKAQADKKAAQAAAEEKEAKKNSGPEEYSKAWWEAKYASGEETDWLCIFEDVRSTVLEHVNKTDKILMVGCGTSPFSSAMFDAGFKDITNVDVSASCIAKMKKNKPKMKWQVMDVQGMKFDDSGFDVVIDKCLLDSVLLNATDNDEMSLTNTICEIWRVLKPGGKYLSMNISPRADILDHSVKDWREMIAKTAGADPWTSVEEFEGRATIPPPEIFSNRPKGEKNSFFVATKLKQSKPPHSVGSKIVLIESGYCGEVMLKFSMPTVGADGLWKQNGEAASALTWRPLSNLKADATEDVPGPIQSGLLGAELSFSCMILRSDSSEAMIEIEGKKVKQSIGVWHEIGVAKKDGVVMQLKLGRDEDQKIRVRKAVLSLTTTHWISTDVK